MNIFNKVTLQSLRKNKTRTIVTIIGIMLSTALICAVTTSFSSVRQYAINYFEYTQGKWHGNEKGSDYDMYEKIADSDKVADTGYLSYIGFAEIESRNSYKPYLYISGFYESTDGLIPVHLSAGRLPENKNELLIPDHLYYNGSVTYKVGDKLTLEIGDRKGDFSKAKELNIFDGKKEIPHGDTKLDNSESLWATDVVNDDEDEPETVMAEHLDIRETREYTIVGTYERPEFENFQAPGFTALTVPDDCSDHDSVDIYYSMKDAGDIYDFMNDMHLSGATNSDLLMFAGISRYNSYYRVIFQMGTIVIALIMFGSIMLIYNAFSISVSERTKQFGLLSSIGATNKQLKQMVRFEATVVSFIGIPLGILLGIAGMGVTFLAIGNRFAHYLDASYGEPMRLCVSPWAIIAAIVIAVMTIRISAWIPSKRATKISAVEAIRQNADIKQKKYIKTPKLIGKIFGISGVLAHKYFKRSKKKYRSTIISLFMSIVLFISAYSFTAYLVKGVEDVSDINGADYILTLYTSEGAANEDTDPIELTEKLKNTKYISKATYCTKTCHTVFVPEENTQSKTFSTVMDYGDDSSYNAREGYRPYPYMDVCFVADDAFFEYAAECGLDTEKYRDKSSPKALIVDNCYEFNIDAGRMERVKIFKGNEFDIYTQNFDDIEGYYYYQNDEQGNALFYEEGVDEYEADVIKIPFDECCKELTMSIADVTDVVPFFMDSDAPTVVYPFSMMKYVCGDYIDEYFYKAYDFPMISNDIFNGYDEVERTLKANGILYYDFYNYAASVESDRSMVIIIKVFAYGFIILISLIAAANVFNTITTNINLRRREFAMLRSVGMTGKDMRKMLNFECIMYGTKALVYGLPVSIGVTYLIYRAINEGVDTEFTIPLEAVGVAVLSVFAVVFSTMMFSMSKVKKDNPIDALKNENL